MPCRRRCIRHPDAARKIGLSGHRRQVSDVRLAGSLPAEAVFLLTTNERIPRPVCDTAFPSACVLAARNVRGNPNWFLTCHLGPHPSSILVSLEFRGPSLAKPKRHESDDAE